MASIDLGMAMRAAATTLRSGVANGCRSRDAMRPLALQSVTWIAVVVAAASALWLARGKVERAFDPRTAPTAPDAAHPAASR
jgi:hypothetical protein